MKKNELAYNYEAVCDTLIFKKGERFALDSGFYTNKSETVVLRSTNFTGKIIKKKLDA
jgi:hypothetical protein